MKKILAFLTILLSVFAGALAVNARDALTYAESAPGGEVENIDQLIAAFGENSYNESNVEKISDTEIRLNNSIILENPIVIKSGTYTIEGGSCTVARGESCKTAIDVQGGHLTFGRETGDSVEFGKEDEPNLVFDGRNKESGAFIKVGENASLTLNVKILAKNMVSDGNGAFIYAENASEIAIYACRFENCKAKNGGAIYFSDNRKDKDNTKLIIKRSTFESCSAENGGAIYSETVAHLDSVNFNKNQATVSGGAMYFSGSVELQTVTAEENKSEQGGALYNNGVVAAIAFTAVGNEAKNGGALYNKNSCIIKDIYFFENIASESGGAIYNEGAFYLNGGNIMTNDSEICGGGVYSTKGSLFKIEKGDISSCRSKYAGGIYCAGDLIMTGGAIGKNESKEPQIAVFGGLEMSGNAVGYGGDVIGLVRGEDGSFPTVVLKSELTNKDRQHIALYKESNGVFKRINKSGVQIFEGEGAFIDSALKVFSVECGGVLPYKISSDGEMRRAFPTVLVIVSASALAVGAIGFVVGKKMVKVKREKKREP